MSPVSKLIRVVIDTNVLFSATALPKNSPPSRILELARTGKIAVFASPFIFGELEKNLAQKARWDEERLLVLRKKLRGFVTLIEPASKVNVIKTVEPDNRILECALDAEADVLVTGNMKHIRPLEAFKGIKILTPREFLGDYFPGK